MSHVAQHADFRSPTAYSAAPAAVSPRKSLLRRLFDAMMLSRQRQTQRDIDRVVSWRAGRFTDSLEREIAERSYSDGWNFRR
jgi:hypothetical protein